VVHIKKKSLGLWSCVQRTGEDSMGNPGLCGGGRELLGPLDRGGLLGLAATSDAASLPERVWRRGVGSVYGLKA
jgi:hypothetical protein